MDSFIRSDVEKILQFYSEPFDVVVIADTAYRFAAENDSAQPVNVSALIRPGCVNCTSLGSVRTAIIRDYVDLTCQRISKVPPP